MRHRQERKILREFTITNSRKHLDLLAARWQETEPTAVVKQAHERLVGGRKQPNKEKILSLYDPDIQVIVRGKSGVEVEFGNNLWLGETREGIIVDYLLEKDKTADAKQISPAIERLVGEQGLPVGKVRGDRGLHGAANETALQIRA